MTYAEEYLREYLELTPFRPEWAITEKDLRSLKHHLRYTLATDLEVRFRRCIIKDGAFANTDLVVPKKKGELAYFLIRVDKRLPLCAQWLVIIHEYAHALQWRPPAQESQRLDDHDGEWGIAEARCWNEVGG
jgi:hypothetical protein